MRTWAAVATGLALLSVQDEKPSPFAARGRLVCLLEEMKERHQAEAPPVHPHVWGFRVEGKAENGVRYYTLLRNKHSEALFADERFRGRDLRLTGRVFPATAILEVNSFQWYKDGKLHDVYYWCEVCAIRGVDPSTCACCQDKVELRESPAEK